MNLKEKFMDKQAVIGAIELGGTKTIAILSSGQTIIEQQVVPTEAPQNTLQAIMHILSDWNDKQLFDAIGIASFGPVGINKDNKNYGTILTTPKPNWSDTDLIGSLREKFSCPIAIETDVTAAAMAEYRWGAGQGCNSLIYITIGTGLGGGILINGQPVHGNLHPEMGHIKFRRCNSDGFEGLCPFHGDCIEGLISGPALKARFGEAIETISANDPRWQEAAHDLSQFLASLIYTLSPQKILIGGGVGLGAQHLVAQAKLMLPELLGGYFPDMNDIAIDNLISMPHLKEKAGPMGAVAVGLQAISVT